MRTASAPVSFLICATLAVSAGCDGTASEESTKLTTVLPIATEISPTGFAATPDFFGQAMLSAEPFSVASSNWAMVNEQRLKSAPGSPTDSGLIEVGAAFLGCFKGGVIDCGGAHNNGNCSTFRYWNASTASAWRFMGCISTMGASCAAQHVGGVLACGLFF